MPGEDAALCRAVTDVYRAAIEDALADVGRRMDRAVAGCHRVVPGELRLEARLTLFTRCLAERVRKQPGAST